MVRKLVARAVDRLTLLAARARVDGDLARHRLRLGLRCKTCGGVVKIQWYRCPYVSETDQMLASCHGSYASAFLRDGQPRPLHAISRFLDRAANMPRREGVFNGTT